MNTANSQRQCLASSAFDWLDVPTGWYQPTPRIGEGCCSHARASGGSPETPHLSEKALDQLRDGHPAGNSVGVNDDVRHDAVDRPGHVLLPVRHTDRALLPVSRRELVADLRDADVPDAHLRTSVSGIGQVGTGGGKGYSFVACLSPMIIDHASFSRQ